MAPPQISFAGRNGHKKPKTSEKFRGVPGSSGGFRGVPGSSGEFRGVPGRLRKFRGVPGRARLFFLKIKGQTTKFRGVPGETAQVPGSSGAGGVKFRGAEAEKFGRGQNVKLPISARERSFVVVGGFCVRALRQENPPKLTMCLFRLFSPCPLTTPAAVITQACVEDFWTRKHLSTKNSSLIGHPRANNGESTPGRQHTVSDARTRSVAYQTRNDA